MTTPKTFVIPQIPSGNIHQLASQHYDITLTYNRGNRFAILIPSYYNGGGAECYAQTLEGAQKACRRVGLDYNPTIIEDNGDMYDSDGRYMGHYAEMH